MYRSWPAFWNEEMTLAWVNMTYPNMGCLNIPTLVVWLVGWFIYWCSPKKITKNSHLVHLDAGTVVPGVRWDLVGVPASMKKQVVPAAKLVRWSGMNMCCRWYPEIAPWPSMIIPWCVCVSVSIFVYICCIHMYTRVFRDLSQTATWSNACWKHRRGRTCSCHSFVFRFMECSSCMPVRSRKAFTLNMFKCTYVILGMHHFNTLFGNYSWSMLMSRFLQHAQYMHCFLPCTECAFADGSRLDPNAFKANQIKIVMRVTDGFVSLKIGP